MRTFLIALFSLSLCLAQTSNYPTSLDNDRSLFIVADNVQSTLAAAMTTGSTTASVGSSTGFAANQIATICDTVTSTGKCTAYEHMLVTAVNGNVLTVTRAFAGTSARAHVSGKLITILIDAAHQQALKAGVIAIETALGANLSNVNGYNVTRYNFAAQTPGGSLISGGAGQSITLTPCPGGLAGADSAHYIYISGGTGTAEATLITGGTCTSGATTGTITVTPANAHSGSWTVSSASFGLHEAINAAGAAGGGTVIIPAGVYTLRATVTVKYSNIIIQGGGGLCCMNGTWIVRTGDFGDSISLGTTATAVAGIGIYDLAMSHTLNYSTGDPGTLSNKPTSGAHIRAWGTNTLNIARVRLENLVYDIVLTGATATVVRDSQFYGAWNGTSASTEVTQNQILINQASSGSGAGIPTYIALINNIHTGPVSTSTYTGMSSRRNVEIDACEDCYIEGGSMERGYEHNVLLSATDPYVLFNVRISNVKFDSAGTADVRLQGDGTAFVANVTINGNTFNGELAGPTAISVPTASPGEFPVQGAVITNNQFYAHLSTPVLLMDGKGYTISGNNLRYYNAANGFSTAAAASGIYFGDRANRAYGTGNIIGGGAAYEDYGTGSGHTKYGVAMAGPTGNQASINVGWAPPTAGALSVYTPTIGGSCGTSPSINGLSTSQAGAFTTGATGSPTSCTVTFAVPFTHVPLCVVSNAAGAATPAITPASATLVVTTTTNSATYNWSCQ